MKPTRKCERNDALVFKTEEATYVELLRAMRGENRISPRGADVKSVRRTKTGKMVLVLKKHAAKKGTSYKALA